VYFPFDNNSTKKIPLRHDESKGDLKHKLKIKIKYNNIIKKYSLILVSLWGDVHVRIGHTHTHIYIKTKCYFLI